MVAQSWGDAGEPRQRTWAGVAVAGVVEPPVQDGGPVVGGVEFAAAGGCRELGDRVGAVRGEQQQMGAEGGPGRLVGEAGHNLLGGDVQRLHDFASCQVFGGHMEGVDVPGGGVCEPDGRVVLVALQGGGGPGRIVAGQDLLKQVGRGGRVDRLGPDEAVRVAVPDDLQVEVVGDPASGQHGVQLLPGLLAGDQAVHGVGGDPLRGVHGGGVAQLNRLLHVGWRAAERCGRCGGAAPSGHRRRLTLRTVHRSPFFTQSVAVKRRVRLLVRVMTCSPTLAGLPSASIATRRLRAGSPSWVGRAGGRGRVG